MMVGSVKIDRRLMEYMLDTTSVIFEVLSSNSFHFLAIYQLAGA